MKRIYIVSFFLLSFCTDYAQDINFSQFQEIPILRNPALTGVFNGDIRFVAGYRNQWLTVPVNFNTMAASVEYKKQIGLSSY